MKRKLLAAIIAGFVLFQNIGQSVYAANVVEVPATEVDSVYNQEVDSNTITSWPQGPHIYSESGIVMDVDSGAILYAKNIDDQHYPASITKVMTALVALENTQMTDTVKFTWDDIGFLEYGDAHIGMKPDEEISMEDAMYAMLLASANEVSHAIASNTAGGYDNFINMMNAKATELGCKNSHFVNTYGLHDDEHYTSVRDMALISSAVFQYEKFRTITSTRQYTIAETAITNEKRVFQQNHKMLWKGDSRYYEYCVGGKTGYTDQALTTLVTFATKGDMNLVAVVMRTHGGGKNAYKDTREMLDYAFDNFTKTPITENLLGGAIAATQMEAFCGNTNILLPTGIGVDQLTATFQAPTELGDKEGKITYLYGEQPVGTIGVTITDEFYNELHGIEEVKPEDSKKDKAKVRVSFWLKLIIIFFALLLLAFIGMFGQGNYPC